jgi:hypothetical protein
MYALQTERKLYEGVHQSRIAHRPDALRLHICLPELVSLFAFIGRPPL